MPGRIFAAINAWKRTTKKNTMKKRINRKPEAGIQHAILQLLAYHKIPAWRMNSGAYKSVSGTFIRYGNRGMADIIAILPKEYGVNAGKWLAIEVKSLTGRITPAQTEFAAIINNAGGFAVIARSVEDVEIFLGLE